MVGCLSLLYDGLAHIGAYMGEENGNKDETRHNTLALKDAWQNVFQIDLVKLNKKGGIDMQPSDRVLRDFRVKEVVVKSEPEDSDREAERNNVFEDEKLLIKKINEELGKGDSVLSENIPENDRRNDDFRAPTPPSSQKVSSRGMDNVGSSSTPLSAQASPRSTPTVLVQKGERVMPIMSPEIRVIPSPQNEVMSPDIEVIPSPQPKDISPQIKKRKVNPSPQAKVISSEEEVISPLTKKHNVILSPRAKAVKVTPPKNKGSKVTDPRAKVVSSKAKKRTSSHLSFLEQSDDSDNLMAPQSSNSPNSKKKKMTMEEQLQKALEEVRAENRDFEKRKEREKGLDKEEEMVVEKRVEPGRGNIL